MFFSNNFLKVFFATVFGVLISFKKHICIIIVIVLKHLYLCIVFD